MLFRSMKMDGNESQIQNLASILLNNALSYTPEYGSIEMLFLSDSDWLILLALGWLFLSDSNNEAIYIPEGIEPPPKSVIECPELQEYIVEFGNRKHDKALVAEIQGNVVGAIWVRIMNDYGHIDNDTPSLAMSVCPQYRGLGIGTSLLKQLLQVERLAGYSKISLSVQKSNYAVKMYEKVGFTVVNENSEEFIMIVNL